MNWHNQLITLYVYVCKHYESNLWACCQRFTSYANLSFSDEEVIYLELLIKRRKKTIYEYAERHLHDWFPKLPCYTPYVQRLNKVADVFTPLLEIISVHDKKITH